jgi:hypothetical protein
MSAHGEWQSIEQEEQALLGRCKSFVFGSPRSAGGGSKDILYLTPCGRWLRICAGNVLHGDPDSAHFECASRLDSEKAAELFDVYRWPRPPELDRPATDRDFEVATDMKYRLYDTLSSRKGHLAFEPPGAPEEISGVEEEIPRNSLITYLRIWAQEWPEGGETLAPREALDRSPTPSAATVAAEPNDPIARDVPPEPRHGGGRPAHDAVGDHDPAQSTGGASRPPVPIDKFTDFQNTLLKALQSLGEGVHNARNIAQKAGYPRNSRLAEALSLLVKLGYLDSTPRGYRLRGRAPRESAQG